MKNKINRRFLSSCVFTAFWAIVPFGLAAGQEVGRYLTFETDGMVPVGAQSTPRRIPFNFVVDTRTGMIRVCTYSFGNPPPLCDQTAPIAPPDSPIGRFIFARKEGSAGSDALRDSTSVRITDTTNGNIHHCGVVRIAPPNNSLIMNCGKILGSP